MYLQANQERKIAIKTRSAESDTLHTTIYTMKLVASLLFIVACVAHTQGKGLNGKC